MPTISHMRSASAAHNAAHVTASGSPCLIALGSTNRITQMNVASIAIDRAVSNTCALLGG
jgi:hypothetical protein